jgi:hypothetical protein
MPFFFLSLHHFYIYFSVLIFQIFDKSCITEYVDTNLQHFTPKHYFDENRLKINKFLNFTFKNIPSTRIQKWTCTLSQLYIKFIYFAEL